MSPHSPIHTRFTRREVQKFKKLTAASLDTSLDEFLALYEEESWLEYKQDIIKVSID